MAWFTRTWYHSCWCCIHLATQDGSMYMISWNYNSLTSVYMLGADTVYERFDEERYGAVLAYHQTVLAPPCGRLNHLVRVSHQPLSLPHRTTRFIYDFISYPFGLYTTTVISGIVPSNASLNITFGWSVVIKCVPIHEIEPQWSDLPIPACFLCQGQSLAHSSSTILVPSTAR